MRHDHELVPNHITWQSKQVSQYRKEALQEYLRQNTFSFSHWFPIFTLLHFMTQLPDTKHQALMNRAFTVTCFLVIILMASLASAQQTGNAFQLFVTSYGTEQGLNQSMVSQVIQDNRGLIWMVTGDGLQCFDGKEFRSFRVTDPVSGEYSDNIMREIVEHRPGEFIISTSSSLLEFNSSSGKFHTIIHKAGYYPRVLTHLCARQPMVWLADKKLAYISGNKIIPVNLQFPDKNPVPGDFFATHDVITHRGDLVVDSDGGILIIEGIGNSIQKVNNARWIKLDDGCQGLAIDKSGNALILSGDKIFGYKGSGKLEVAANTRRFTLGHMFADSKGIIWISDRSARKLYCIRDGITSQADIFIREGNHTFPLQPEIIAVFEDKQGNLWFGTDSDGMFCYSPDQMQFNYAKTGFTRCLAYLNNSIYAGTFKNGLWKLSEDLSVALKMKLNKVPAEIYFLDIAADRYGHLWLATDKGLYVTDTSGALIFSHQAYFKADKLLKYGNDTMISLSGNHMHIFRTSGKPALISSAEFAYMRAFCKEGTRYWIGTPFGLYITTASEGIRSLQNAFKHEPVNPEPVYALLMLDGVIWSATEHGIRRYTKEGKMLPALPVTEELRNHVIYTLVPDPYNRLWFSSNRGVGCITEKLDRIIWFNTRNNLQSLEFNSNACLQSPSGWIYFGGINGINGFNPLTFKPVKTAPDIRIISLSISDTAYSGGIPPGLLNLEINWRSPHISGSVFTTDYFNPGMQQFSFCLKGYQAEWSRMSTNPEFSYRNLSPGKYSLLVKCADSYKNISDALCLLTFTIRPPFWKTWWFNGLTALLLFVATILIVRKIQDIRYRDKLRELEKQNAINKERLRIAKDMHDEVGASLTRISILSELAKNREDDRQESMSIISRISEISGNVVDEMSEIIWAMNPKNDSLDSFASYLRRYASEYLESAGIDCHFQFPEDVPPYPMNAELRRNIFLIAKESLHNIVKHANAAQVALSLEFTHDRLALGIQDDGCGFDTAGLAGTGNGLINMQKRAQELGGSFNINSSPDQGTNITFSVSLKV